MNANLLKSFVAIHSTKDFSLRDATKLMIFFFLNSSAKCFGIFFSVRDLWPVSLDLSLNRSLVDVEGHLIDE